MVPQADHRGPDRTRRVQVIEFEPEGHIYRVDGRVFPSVTQVLEPYTGLEFVDRETLRRAAEFGNHVHQAVHLYNVGELDEQSLDPALVPYLDGWKLFLYESGATVILSEHRVASRRYQFAGTLDDLLFWGNSKRLIDVKSGSVVPKTTGPQLAAYGRAYFEETGERIRYRRCVHLPGEGKYKVIPLNNPRDWPIFQCALTIHKWINT